MRLIKKLIYWQNRELTENLCLSFNFLFVKFKDLFIACSKGNLPV